MKRVPERELMDLPEEAQAYARADFAQVNEAFVARLLELAGSRDDAQVVDLGAGPADIPIALASARPRWRIIGVEGAAAMLRIARHKLNAAGVCDRVQLHRADAKSTALRSHSFDVVISNSLLHHMPDPLPLWRQIRRLAAPGALIFLRDLMRPAGEATARAIVHTHAAHESELLQQEFYRSLLAAFEADEVRAQLRHAALSSFLQVEVTSDRHFDVFGYIPTP